MKIKFGGRLYVFSQSKIYAILFITNIQIHSWLFRTRILIYFLIRFNFPAIHLCAHFSFAAFFAPQYEICDIFFKYFIFSFLCEIIFFLHVVAISRQALSRGENFSFSRYKSERFSGKAFRGKLAGRRKRPNFSRSNLAYEPASIAFYDWLCKIKKVRAPNSVPHLIRPPLFKNI